MLVTIHTSDPAVGNRVQTAKLKCNLQVLLTSHTSYPSEVAVFIPDCKRYSTCVGGQWKPQLL